MGSVAGTTWACHLFVRASGLLGFLRLPLRLFPTHSATACAFVAHPALGRAKDRDCSIVSNAADVIDDSNMLAACEIWTREPSAATTTYGHISTWNTSGVTNMSFLFAEKESFDADLSLWNTSRVTTFEGMFYRAEAFNHSLEKWDVGNAQNLRNMFAGATSFDQNLASWRIPSSAALANIFGCDGNCTGLSDCTKRAIYDAWPAIRTMYPAWADVCAPLPRPVIVVTGADFSDGSGTRSIVNGSGSFDVIASTHGGVLALTAGGVRVGTDAGFSAPSVTLVDVQTGAALALYISTCGVRASIRHAPP